MAAKKKVTKKRSGRSAFAGSSRCREQALLRPKHVEKLPPCRHACPSGNRIREFLTTIGQAQRLEKPTEQAFEQAWEIYTDTSPFPAVCGRVCPHLCETQCNRKALDGAVNINQIERAIGDFGLEKKLKLKTLSDEKRPEKIAVVGAGPGGLSCAYQLARRGYDVTVFEAAEKPGGRLLWGIPRHRLPADVLEGEIQKILDLGVQLKSDTPIGKDISLEYLRAQYQAVVGGHQRAGHQPKVGPEAWSVGPGAEKGWEFEVNGVCASGHAASLALVSTAIGQGRQTAESIDLKFRGKQAPEKSQPPLIQADRMRLDHYENKERARAAALPVEQGPAGMDTEVNLPLSPAQVIEETSRCMSCGFCFDCEKCWLFCQEQAIDKPLGRGALYSFKPQNCTGCGKCAKECPCGFIDML